METSKQVIKLEHYDYSHRGLSELARNWNINQQGQFGIKLFPAQMYAMIFDWRNGENVEGTAYFIEGHLYTDKKTKYVIESRHSATRVFKGLSHTGTGILIDGQVDKEKKATHKHPFYFESFAPGTITPHNDWKSRPEKNYHLLSLPAWQITLESGFVGIHAERWLGELVREVAKASKGDETQLAYATITGDVLTMAFKPDACLADFINIYGGWTSNRFLPVVKYITTKLLWQPHDLALAHVEQGTSSNLPYFALVEKEGKAICYYGTESEMTGMVANMLDDLDMTVWHIGRLWVPSINY